MVEPPGPPCATKSGSGSGSSARLGKTATAEDAQAAHARIRSFIQFGLYDGDVAGALRIQYGGSVKPGNAAELFSQKDIDGGLIGGASLKSADFTDIVNAASQAVAAG